MPYFFAVFRQHNRTTYGVIMRKETGISVFALLLFTVTLVFAAASDAEQHGTLSQEARSCLSCHAKHEAVVTFENNEFVDVHIDEDTFKASAHGFFPCSRCHSEFSKGRHPKRIFRSKLHFQTKAALVCRHCHSDNQLKASPIHASLLGGDQQESVIICTNCHGSHSIKPVSKAAKFSNEEAYCIKCHGYSVNMQFRSGETLSVTINRSTLQSSVHDKLSCSDCHYGFSSEEHPKRKFATRRDYTIASSENCRRCHFDKYTKTMESIHYTMLSQGNLRAPVCIDCHGSHGISHVGRERALIAKRCQRCHAAIYDVYARSVHGNALFNENNQDVPVCADCHTAHTIEDPTTLNYRERIPDICSNCHANKAIVGKYGLSTAVVDSYLSDFHGITLKFYKLQGAQKNKPVKPMAVCTDCHGSHNITNTVGPDASIVKANLRKRCQKCHADASRNFPDSWLSHYEPSFTRSPLVFLITIVYKIFIPVLVIGLVLQILLHIWRYVVNR